MKTQPLDVALAAAIYTVFNIPGPSSTAQQEVDALKAEVARQGFMVVPLDFGKEGVEADTFFATDDPEDVRGDPHELVDEIGGHSVIEIGRSVLLPPKFAVRIPVDDGGYKTELYDTRAEAEAMCKSIYGGADA